MPENRRWRFIGHFSRVHHHFISLSAIVLRPVLLLISWCILLLLGTMLHLELPQRLLQLLMLIGEQITLNLLRDMHISLSQLLLGVRGSLA